MTGSNGRPLVTVMIPSYNYERYLRECVESAASQVGVDLDVVIVENASTDGSLAIARELEQRYDCVRLVVHPDNQGIICSLNRCRDEVRGDYAVLLCADDCLTPGSLARSIAYMEQHPEVGLVYGPTIHFAVLDEVTPDRYAGRPAPPIRYRGNDWIGRRCRAGTNAICTPEAVMRSSVIDDVGLLDPACPHTSDLNMWLRIAAVSDVAYLPGPAQALYRKHGANHSEPFIEQVLPDIEARWCAYQRFFETLGARPERASWDRDARRALAEEARFAATRAFVTLAEPEAHERADALLRLADELDAAGPVEQFGWRVRRSLGPKASRWFPAFLPRGVHARVSRQLAQRHLERTGI